MQIIPLKKFIYQTFFSKKSHPSRFFQSQPIWLTGCRKKFQFRVENKIQNTFLGMRYEWQCRRSSLPVKAMAHTMDQKAPKLTKIDHKTESQVSFKVTLLRNDSKFAKPGDLCLFDKIEVRRFVIPKERSTSLVYLKERLRSLEVQPRDQAVQIRI